MSCRPVAAASVPDLLATNTTGDLLLYPGDRDPSAGPVSASTAANSPDGTGWNTYQVTHRGSATQQAVDDLFAHKGANLYLYVNNDSTTSMQYTDPTNDAAPIGKPSCAATADNAGNCTGYATTWSGVTQLLAVGDVYAGQSSDNGLPDLVTVENGQLWLYRAAFGNALTQPVLLGTGWTNMTLVAPGVVGGVPALWARDTGTGNLYSYSLAPDANGLPKAIGAPTTGTLIGTAGEFGTATYPSVASPGNLVASGFPGLYAVGTGSVLYFYPGQSGTSPLATTPVRVGTLTGSPTQLN